MLVKIAQVDFADEAGKTTGKVWAVWLNGVRVFGSDTEPDKAKLNRLLAAHRKADLTRGKSKVNQG